MLFFNFLGYLYLNLIRKFAECGKPIVLRENIQNDNLSNKCKKNNLLVSDGNGKKQSGMAIFITNMHSLKKIWYDDVTKKLQGYIAYGNVILVFKNTLHMCFPRGWHAYME